MNRKTAFVMCLAGLTVIGAYALAQEEMARPTPPPVPPPPMMAQVGACPACPMMPDAATQPSAEMTAMMKEAGVTEEMLARRRTMMRTPIYMDSPAALFAQAEELGLSADQKAKLMEIEKQARTQAMDVLTADQKTKLGEVPAEAMTPMQMHMQIHQKMAPVVRKRMMEGKGGMMGCPMMHRMMRPAPPPEAPAVDMPMRRRVEE